jgi:hypothetical protein
LKLPVIFATNQSIETMLEHKENFSRKKTKKEKKLSSQTLSV